MCSKPEKPFGRGILPIGSGVRFALGILVGLAGLPPAESFAGGITVLVDDFNDGTLDPQWVAGDIFDANAEGWTFAESGGKLNVTEIDTIASYCDDDCPGWGTVRLTRSVPLLSDFHVDFNISWDSEGIFDAMQTMTVFLGDQAGDFAWVGYVDAWGPNGTVLGRRSATIVGVQFQSANDLPFAGTAAIEIDRVGSDVTIRWDGNIIQTGTTGRLLSTVRIEFSYFDEAGLNGGGVTCDGGCPCDESGEPGCPVLPLNHPHSVFGAESVDLIRVEGTPVVFVDADATGANNGTSWTNAHTRLQDALAAAISGDEIWVADGTYKPDQGMGITPGDRTATFDLINGVAIYGGFAGTETSLNQRNIVANPTILSGDLADNDLPNFVNYDENSYHVVTGIGTNATTILDGFTVTAGFANGSGTRENGGGIYLNAAAPQIRRCHIFRNATSATEPGFGADGGGVFIDQSSPQFTDCIFENNQARLRGNGGAVVCFSNSSLPVFSNCQFIANSADNGGAMNNISNCMPTINNCVFSANTTGPGGYGGGIHNNQSSPAINGCTFTNNTASYGGGMLNTNGNPSVINSTFLANSADVSGGGLYNDVGSSPTILNCEFLGNTSLSAGGGALVNSNSSNPTIANCLFSGNSAAVGGGAMGNSGGSNPAIASCTFSRNSTGGNGGGIYNAMAGANSPTLHNCVLWENSDSGGMDESAQMYTESGSPTVNFSIVQGGWSGAGLGNLNADPLFQDADGPDNIVGTVDDNVRVPSGSPAVDSGDSCAVPVDTQDLDDDGNTAERVPIDVDGNDRMVGYAVDRGAYENQTVVGGDCNQNGLVDDFDLCSGSSMDVDTDGIPDECTVFDGGCGGNGNWSCAPNWEDNTVPNNGPETYSVQLETAAAAACLDIDVTIDSLLIADGASLDMTGQGGCDGDLSVVASGGLLLDGTLTDMGPCVPGGSAARGGHTPPNLSIRGPGATTIVYSLDLGGIVEFELSSTEPLTLGGDFNNSCTSGLCFDMRDGALLLTGDSPAGPEQRFEAAATDVGTVTTIDDAEYAVGTLEIASGAEVTFSDTFDNDGNGQGPCTEAVYVGTLRVGSPSSITLDNVRVYYDTLEPDLFDPGVIVNSIGCGALVPASCPTLTPAGRFDPSINRNRYLSIMPGNAGQSVALRVSIFTAPTVPSLANQVRWVGMPVAVNDPPNGGNIFVAPLQCNPLFMDWAAFPTINAYGPEVVPSTLSPTQYEVVVVPQACAAFPSAYSTALIVTQAKWGDVRDPYGGASQPNFGDINAIVQKFSNLASAPTITRVDLVGSGNPGQPSTPNRTVSFADVSACVSAFGGFPYPYIGGSCP